MANPFQSLFVGRVRYSTSPIRATTTPRFRSSTCCGRIRSLTASFTGLPFQAALSRYDSMQIRFEKRSGKYFTIQGSYTLARATDNSSSGANGWVGWLTNGGPQELDSLSNEYTVSANNATHRLAAAFTANIPVGRGLLVGNNMNRVVDAVIGGWSASSNNVTLQSGQPVHIQMSQSLVWRTAPRGPM